MLSRICRSTSGHVSRHVRLGSCTGVCIRRLSDDVNVERVDLAFALVDSISSTGDRCSGIVEMAVSTEKNLKASPHAIIVPVDVDDPLMPSRLSDVLGEDGHRLFNSNVLETLKAKKNPVVTFAESSKVVLTPWMPDDGVDIRTSVHRGLDAVRSSVVKNVAVALPENLDPETFSALVRASMLSSHRFDRHLEKNSRFDRIDLLDLNGTMDAAEERVNALQDPLRENVLFAEGTLFAREIVNERADIVTPAYMEDIATRFADKLPHVSAKVISGVDQLKENECHMLSAVGQAATVPPRLVILEIEGQSSQELAPIALVGKGVTFDTGGLNLKPTGSIETMHMDMGGAAAVLGALRSISQLKLQRRVVVALALAENAINERAVKPHAILPSAKGTVEVSNTDAEGRLCLADALSYVQKHYKPTHIVDAATLTGACVVALGEYTAGLFSNDDEMAADLSECGERSFERCWRLPILPEHSAELKGDQSDILSCGKSRYGGASTAAAFLQKFVEKGTSWSHIDIAGPAMYSSKREFMPAGGTGFGAQLIAEYTRHLDAKSSQ